MPETKIDVETLRTVDALSNVESEWQSLFRRGRDHHLANSYPYVFANASVRRCGDDWSAYLTRCEGILSNALFGIRSRVAVGPVRLPIYRVGSEYVDDVLNTDVGYGASLQHLLDAIFEREKTPMIEFGKVTESFFQRIRDELDRQGMKYSWNNEGYGFIWDASADADHMYSQLSYSTRARVRRTRRRLNREFNVEIRRHSSQVIGENLRFFDRFVELEASGWKGLERTAIRYRPGNEDYFRVIVETAARHRLMCWYTLLADGKAVAMNLCIKTPRTFWVPKIAYDEAYAAYSPGLDLLHQVHLDCIADPDTETLNWISAPEWLDSWRPSRLQYYRLRVYHPSLKGDALFAANSLQSFIRRTFTNRGAETADRERRLS